MGLVQEVLQILQEHAERDCCPHSTAGSQSRISKPGQGSGAEFVLTFFDTLKMRELICKRVFFVISKTFRFWKYLKSKICAWEEWSDHVGSTLISLGMFKVMLSWRSQGC